MQITDPVADMLTRIRNASSAKHETVDVPASNLKKAIQASDIGINPNSFDGRGNYAFGLKEQLIFPEIEYDKVDKIRGMNICICTTATTDEEAKELLTQLGAPFHA